MPNGHIAVNIDKTISFATGMGITQGPGSASHRRVVLKTANKRLDCPRPTLQTSSNILQNTVSAIIVVLASSRPRRLRLARTVSSRAIFGVALYSKISIRL